MSQNIDGLEGKAEEEATWHSKTHKHAVLLFHVGDVRKQTFQNVTSRTVNLSAKGQHLATRHRNFEQTLPT